jgi:hypothetical protein
LSRDPTGDHSPDRLAMHNEIDNSQLVLEIFGDRDAIQLEPTRIGGASAGAISSVIEDHKVHPYGL